jgi:hypothetical protein
MKHRFVWPFRWRWTLAGTGIIAALIGWHWFHQPVTAAAPVVKRKLFL